MTHVIEIEDGDDYHAITIRKARTLLHNSESGRFIPPTMNQFAQSAILAERAEGVHPPYQETFQRRFRVDPDSPLAKILDGDQLLADYIASIPEGTPTLKETARRFRRATREAGRG